MARRPTFNPNDPNPFSVKPGQVWENCDPRMRGERLVVLLVRLEPDYLFAVVNKIGTERMKRIKLNRFRPRTNGYKLVQDV